MKYLDDHKLRDNTFVFFTSDNGPETLRRYKGAERSYGSPGPLRGMKLHITEGKEPRNPVFDGKPVKRRHPLYWQYDFAISRPWVVSLRDGPWKLLADAELGRFELYNLVDDVGESKNLAEEHPERVKQMAAAMKRLHEEIAAEGAKSGNPGPRPPKK